MIISWLHSNSYNICTIGDDIVRGIWYKIGFVVVDVVDDVIIDDTIMCIIILNFAIYIVVFVLIENKAN